MNPRIKELIDQATEEKFDYTASSGAKPGEYYSNYKYVLNPEKFAELIVRECIDVFSKDLPDSTSPDYQLGSLPEVVNRVCNVAEHFRVEK